MLIAAIGAEASRPPIEGIQGSHVLSAQDAYVHPELLGDKIVIMGAGLVGVELGLHLKELGKDPVLVEMTDHVNDGGNFLHMLGLKTEIKKTRSGNSF